MKPKNSYQDAPPAYHDILSQLLPALWNDVRNAKTCAQMVLAAIMTDSVSLPDWIPFIVSDDVQAASVQTKLSRFLDNPHLDPCALYLPIITQSLSSWGDHPLIFALDTTMLFNRFCLIHIAIIYRGRSVPLVWSLIEHPSAQVSFEKIVRMLADIKGMTQFLKRHDVVILADRGFVDTKLMSCLDYCGWNYYIRMKEGIKLQKEGANGNYNIKKIKDIQIKEGEVYIINDVRITGKQYGPVNISAGRGIGAKERWVVVSNCPGGIKAFVEYAKRFNIEQGFRDIKSGGFDMEKSKIRKAERLDKLFLIISLAKLACIAIGTALVDKGKRRKVDYHYRRQCSYMKIGMRLMKAEMAKGRRVEWEWRLYGGEDPDPSPRSSRGKSAVLDSIKMEIYI